MTQLSIIIPAYRKPESLRRLLRSIAATCDPSHTEVVISIDDGREVNDLREDIPPACNAMAVSTGAIGSGAVAATNYAVSFAIGRCLWFLGDDCEIVTNGIDSVICDALQEGPDIVVGVDDGIDGRAHPAMNAESWRERIGFSMDYHHYYCDTEIYRLARHAGDWRLLRGCRIIHHHPYSTRHGVMTDIIEPQTRPERDARDGDTFAKRLEWWVDHGCPRFVPRTLCGPPPLGSSGAWPIP